MPSAKSGRVIAIDYHDTQVTIDYGTGLLVVEKILFQEYPLTLGQEVDEKMIKFYMSEGSFQRGIKKALHWLSIRDFTTHELRLKFKDDMVEPVLDRIIDYLTSLNYLGDEQYVIEAIEKAKHDGKGTNRLKEELHLRGINQALIELVVDYYPLTEEIEIATNFIQKQMVNKEVTMSLLRSLQQKLFARGFSEEVIEHVIRPLVEMQPVGDFYIIKKGRRNDD